MKTRESFGIVLTIRFAACMLAGAAPVVYLMSATGCAGAMSLGGGDTGLLGVTTGGQQDIAAARLAIEQGHVPDPASITVEGFLSEHSIEIEQPDDAGLLYTTTSVAWNRDFDTFGGPLATLQIGFGTTIDQATFERPSLNLCLVIDRSGSMGDFLDERSRTSKLDAVMIAIDRLIAQLTGLDQVSIVIFNKRSSTILECCAPRRRQDRRQKPEQPSRSHYLGHLRSLLHHDSSQLVLSFESKPSRFMRRALTSPELCGVSVRPESIEANGQTAAVSGSAPGMALGAVVLSLAS